MAGDLFYSHRLLGLHCDGANNSKTFIDSSPSPKTVTAYGSAKIVTDTNQMDGSCAYFDGSQGYLGIPMLGLDLGAGEFCVELGYTPISASVSDRVFQTASGDIVTGLYLSHGSTTALGFNFSSNGTSFQGSGINLNLVQNVRSHLAFERVGNVITAYRDGQAVGTLTVSGAMYYNSSHVFVIGGQATPERTPSAKIDEFYIYNVAKYKGNFTPPAGPLPDYQSQIAGTISETLAANSFRARAYDIETGALVGEKLFTDSSSFTVDIKTAAKSCFVTVAADYNIWKASTNYAIGDKVHPANPVATPYYYKRLAAGTSGATEPTWPTTPGGQCNDGAVNNAWEMVERLIQPVTHGPLIPS